MIKKVSIKSGDGKKVLEGMALEPKLKVSIDTSSISYDEVTKLEIKLREELGNAYIPGCNTSDALSENGVIEPRLEFECVVDEKTPSINQETIQRILKSFDELYGYRIIDDGLCYITKAVDFKFNSEFEDENTVAAGVLVFGDKFKRTKSGDYIAKEWYNVCHINPKNPNYGDRNEIKKYFGIRGMHTKIETEENAVTEGTVNVFGNFNYLMYRINKIGEKRSYKNINKMEEETTIELSMVHFVATTGFVLMEHEGGILKKVVFKSNETKALQSVDMNTLANHLMKSWVEKKFTKGANFLFQDDMKKISEILKRETIITESDIEALTAEKNAKKNGGRFNRRGNSPENMSYNPFKDIDSGAPAEKPKKEKKAAKPKAEKVKEVVEQPVAAEVKQEEVQEATQAEKATETQEPIEEEVV